jgi:hypothetical protein
MNLLIVCENDYEYGQVAMWKQAVFACVKIIFLFA